MPDSTIRTIKRRAGLESGISFSPVSVIAPDDGIAPDNAVTPNDGVTPDNAETCGCVITPDDGVTTHDGIAEDGVIAPDNGVAPYDGITPDNAVSPDDGGAVHQRYLAAIGVIHCDGRCSAAIGDVIVAQSSVHIQITGPDGKDIVLCKIGIAPHVLYPTVGRIVLPRGLHQAGLHSIRCKRGVLLAQ